MIVQVKSFSVTRREWSNIDISPLEAMVKNRLLRYSLRTFCLSILSHRFKWQIYHCVTILQSTPRLCSWFKRWSQVFRLVICILKLYQLTIQWSTLIQQVDWNIRDKTIIQQNRVLTCRTDLQFIDSSINNITTKVFTFKSQWHGNI